jgi:chemotaxis-related protein WspB
VLLLLFYAGDERYALETKRVVEVVPLIALKKLHHAPEYVAGLFNYRGQIVPVIDLCLLIQGTPCRGHLSTRIIMVNYLGSHVSNSSSSEHQPHLLGLMAERVTDTLNKAESDFVAPGIAVDTAPYLGEILTDEKGMIQFVRIDKLLPESQLINLLPAPEAKEVPVASLQAAE